MGKLWAGQPNPQPTSRMLAPGLQSATRMKSSVILYDTQWSTQLLANSSCERIRSRSDG